MESHGIKHNKKTYSMLINGFTQLKDYANAFNVFEEMTKSGLVPDQVIYNNIIEAFCKMRNMDRALRIVDKMRRERLQTSSRTFRPIIEGFALAGDMKRGIEVFDLMRQAGCVPTVETYNALIHGLVRKNQVLTFLHPLFCIGFSGLITLSNSMAFACDGMYWLILTKLLGYYKSYDSNEIVLSSSDHL